MSLSKSLTLSPAPLLSTGVKVFRIVCEFRMLSLTFHRSLNSAGNNSFSDLVSV